MKKLIKTPITGARGGGLVSIWWYTDSKEFWDFSLPTDDGIEQYGYVQYSPTQNHMTLWRRAVREHIDDTDEQNKVISLGYKSFERGRIIYNVRTQCYEITCSNTLFQDPEFRSACVAYFNLSGNRYEFVKLDHYSKQSLTGNPALDAMYYDSQF